MINNKNISLICIVVVLCGVLFTIVFMNGERFGIERVADEDSEYHSKEVAFTDNDLDGSWDTDDATLITLNGDSAVVSGTGAFVNGSQVVIKAAGKYVLKGSLTDGNISVDAYDSSKVFVMLDGIDIYCSDDAAFRVECADKVFLTLAEGSDNTLGSGEKYSDEALNDNTGGTVFSHDDLTVNGSGSLTVKAEYKHGFDVNDELVITGGTISVSSPGDAMHVNDSLRICNADITVEAEDDALHCDNEILVESGSIKINDCYEGLESPSIEVTGGEINILCRDDGFNANGGTDAFGGFGGRPGETTDQADTEKTDAETDDEDPCITVSGGNITIMNPTGRDADGFDSNGDVLISGGNIRISLTGTGMNNAIDFGSESGGKCIVTGGTVIACGGSNMTEAFDSSSTQCAVLYNFSGGTEDGDEFILKDADGNVLLSWEVPYSFTSVGFSCPEMQKGVTYTVVTGSSEEQVTLDEMSVTAGDATSMFGGGMNGGGNGEMRHGGFGKLRSDADGSEDADGGSGTVKGGNEGSEGNEGGFPGPPSDMPDFPSDMPEPPDMSGDRQHSGPPGMQGGPGREAEQESTAVIDTRKSLSELTNGELNWLILSGAAILAGIVLAVFYKRRR